MARVTMEPVGIWTGALDFVSMPEAQELAIEIEALGYGALWLPEVAGRDVFAHLALLLSATTRLVGATGIANIWGRDAVAMSGGAKALTEAFPERVLVGLGVSHPKLVGAVRGHRYERPLTRMRGYLDELAAAPYTAFRPTTPVRLLLAALGPRMLALAGERTDGAHTFFVPPEHTGRARATLGPEPLLCVEQAVLLERDAEPARAIGREHAAVYLQHPGYADNMRRLGFTDDELEGGGSDRLVDAIVAWGDVDTVIRRVAEHLAAGADHVCVNALAPGKRAVPVDTWRELAPAAGELEPDRLR